MGLIKKFPDVARNGIRLRFIGQEIIRILGGQSVHPAWSCLLYTSDAADERSSVDLGGRRIIKKKNTEDISACERHSIDRDDEERNKDGSTAGKGGRTQVNTAKQR